MKNILTVEIQNIRGTVTVFLIMNGSVIRMAVSQI